MKFEEAIKEMVLVPSPLQDGVTEFVPKDEFKFIKLTEKADLLFHNGKFPDAESLYTRAYEVAKSSKKRKLCALALLGMGASKGMQGNYAEAIRLFRQGLRYKREIKNNIATGRIYFNLGYCYQITNRPNEAIKITARR